MIALGRLRGMDGGAIAPMFSPPNVVQPAVPGRPAFQAAGYMPKLPNSPRYLTRQEQWRAQNAANVALYQARLSGV